MALPSPIPTLFLLLNPRRRLLLRRQRFGAEVEAGGHVDVQPLHVDSGHVLVHRVQADLSQLCDGCERGGPIVGHLEFQKFVQISEALSKL